MCYIGRSYDVLSTSVSLSFDKGLKVGDNLCSHEGHHGKRAGGGSVSESEHLGNVVSVSGARVMISLRSDLDNGDGRSVQLGSILKMRTSRSVAFGVVGRLTMETSPGGTAELMRMAELDFLGEAVAGPDKEVSFQRGVSIYPCLEEKVLPATSKDLARIYAKPKASNIRIGVLHQDENLPAYMVTDDLLGKHFAILGTTGSGKSCTAAVILRSILDEHPNGHVILLDPHDEYGRSFGEEAEVITTSNLELPYWLLNFEELAEALCSPEATAREAEAAILKDAVTEAKLDYFKDKDPGYPITVDTPTPFRLHKLLSLLNDAMGGLNKPGDAVPYRRLISRIETLSRDKRYAFMFSGLVVRDNMAEVLSRILRIPVGNKPLTIFNISGVPSEIVDVVVSLLCRLVFDFAIWSKTGRQKAVPVLFVCEEAHRYVPRDQERGFAPTRRAISALAKEGRKYGVSLGLVTQRPSEVSTTILSQCNTLIALRMSNELDQQFVRNAMPESGAGLLNGLPSLRTQEAVVVGEGVTMPMRIRFNELKDAIRPHSDTASFSKAWLNDDVDGEFIRSTVARWRSQER